MPVPDHVSWQERDLPASQRTTWKGTLAPFPVTSTETGARNDLRAAAIWSQKKPPPPPPDGCRGRFRPYGVSSSPMVAGRRARGFQLPSAAGCS